MNQDELRRFLADEVALVEVRPDALTHIRDRIAARRRRWWSPAGHPGGLMIVSATGAAAAVVAVLLGIGASCAPRPAPAPLGASPTAPAPTPSAAGPSGTQLTAAVPVYFVGIDQGRPRLYREFHTVPVGDGGPAARARAAVGYLLNGEARDPDYQSPWPPGVYAHDVLVEAGTVTVILGGVSAGGPSAERSSQAVQQLIWTATAASDTDVARLLFDGKIKDLLWGVPVAGDLRRAPAAQVLGLVWLIDPGQGTTVARSFTVHVAGIVFEATMHLRVRQGSRVVTDQVVTLSRGAPEQGEAFVPVTLSPGTYTIEGYATSAQDGSEQHLDDHTITVR